MIKQRYKKIYVICAAYYKTGGTEVIHQLVYHINQLGGNAYIAYLRLYDVPSLCNPAFAKYVDESHFIEVGDIEDENYNAVIIPEGYPEYIDRYKNAVKMLWWLSVDNFEGIYGFDDNKIDKEHKRFENAISYHLVQSEYARIYLLNKGTAPNRILHLADYINDTFLDDDTGSDHLENARENIILYNPKKGEQSTRSIMEAGPELNYTALIDMTTDEIRDLMNRSKVYIDFGNHPGKDRIPREAAMSGLIVITGRHGSADNPIDICIPDRYKLKEEKVSGKEVVDLIKDCLDNYLERIDDFSEYRNLIRGEKAEFIEDIRKIFFDFKVGAKDYSAVSPQGVLIVMVSYNTMHFTQECIKSIRNTLPEGSYKIVVVDNASTDGSDKWLEEQKDILFLGNEENTGFGPACNQAVKATEGTEYGSYDVFLLNNDTRLTDNAVYFLKKALYSAKDIGAVGSISNYAGNRQQVDIQFDSVMEYIEYGCRKNVPTEDPIEERVRLSGFSMLIKRNAWNEIGGFDEDFAPGYFEDDALSIELLKKGYRLLLVKNSFIYHAGSQSFSKVDFNKLLIHHRELFVKKYGFDIIDYAYSDDAMLMSLMNGEKMTGVRILQIGSGLGADLKALRRRYPECDIVGVESNRTLYEIARQTETVFVSPDSLASAYDEEYFDVLIIKDGILNALSERDRKIIAKLCKKDAVLITGKDEYGNFPFDKIKMVIWDLDDTLWEGIISEGDVTLSDSNISLIKMLIDHGIVNSISSKNDEAPVEKKLREAGIWDDFVFNSINWDEKGSQIADKINVMGLRAENVLFIDDNKRNLEEAGFRLSSLMTAEPDIIPYLYDHYSKLTPKDTGHLRLEQYKLLERKTNAKSSSAGMSKEQFLFDSNIRITINRNCLEELERIHELVMRTNQLNYTKNRDGKELLTRQITNDWNDCAYIKVRDRFGDYGIVGFYCYNIREKVMEHFLFSCRVIGMGIEQYIYNKLGNPEFDVKEPVAIHLSNKVDIGWISEADDEAVEQDMLVRNRVRILLKGPCDMSAIEPYLAGANITTEFNYVNEYGFVTTGQNHTQHIIESNELKEDEIDEILKEAPFIIKGDFETKIFSSRYHVICLSLLQDLAAGLYRNKRTGHYISFSSRNYDLTDPKFSDRFINKEIQGHNFDFTEDIISDFADKWEFAGSTALEMLLDNLEYIYENVQGKPLIILLLGSETDYNKNTEEFAGMCEIYREINPVIKAFSEDHERIKVIDPTEFIRSQDDFEDCINHYSRRVYYEIAGRICEYINNFV